MIRFNVVKWITGSTGVCFLGVNGLGKKKNVSVMLFTCNGRLNFVNIRIYNRLEYFQYFL